MKVYRHVLTHASELEDRIISFINDGFTIFGVILGVPINILQHLYFILGRPVATGYNCELIVHTVRVDHFGHDDLLFQVDLLHYFITVRAEDSRGIIIKQLFVDYLVFVQVLDALQRDIQFVALHSSRRSVTAVESLAITLLTFVRLQPVKLLIPLMNIRCHFTETFHVSGDRRLKFMRSNSILS